MATWTDITNAEVAAGAPITTALMTALRDNQIAFAERDAAAPKILGAPYNYQEFTASGTWTKPSNAETGDKVIIHIVGGGGAGGSDTLGGGGGGGGGGLYMTLDDIDLLDASYSITVGAGAAGAGPSAGSNGGSGGASFFGTLSLSAGNIALYANGGGGGVGANAGAGGSGGIVEYGSTTNEGPTEDSGSNFAGGTGGTGGTGTGTRGRSCVFGAGGGGGTSLQNGGAGGHSAFAGRGGHGTDTSGTRSTYDIEGYFPGGGGGALDNGISGSDISGAGADGVVKVWCIKESA